LKGLNLRLLTPENAALMEFITTNDCRQTILNRYQDGQEHEADCVSLEAEPCDNCISAKNISKCQKRKLEFELEEFEKRGRFERYNRRTK